jgi:hypothetical protein
MHEHLLLFALLAFEWAARPNLRMWLQALHRSQSTRNFFLADTTLVYWFSRKLPLSVAFATLSESSTSQAIPKSALFLRH